MAAPPPTTPRSRRPPVGGVCDADYVYFQQPWRKLANGEIAERRGAWKSFSEAKHQVQAGCFKPDPIILGPLTGGSVSAEIQRKRRSETQPPDIRFGGRSRGAIRSCVCCRLSRKQRSQGDIRGE